MQVHTFDEANLSLFFSIPFSQFLNMQSALRFQYYKGNVLYKQVCTRKHNFNSTEGLSIFFAIAHTLSMFLMEPLQQHNYWLIWQLSYSPRYKLICHTLR